MDPPREIAIYLHRAGRTGRVEKKGSCVTFYNNKNVENLEKIESYLDIFIEKRGLPC